MKIRDVDTLPHLYLDMDGVQADFFTAWAQAFGKGRYKEIGDRASREASIDQLNAKGPEWVKEFFATLPVLAGGMKVIRWLRKNNIPYTVLSAPLRGNAEASIAGKRIWLDRHHPGSSATAIFTGNKEQYATQHGKPAVLVDDYKSYIQRWSDAGGIALLFRDHQVDDVIAKLRTIYNID